MIRVFQIVAMFLAVITVYFLWNDDLDNTFVTGVLAIVSFLLSVRFQIKTRIKERADQEAASRDRTELDG